MLVRNDDIKRNKWPLGQIVDVKPGEDEIVRVAEVRMKDGSYMRPVAKLFKLEDNLFDMRHGEEDVADDKSATV